MKIGLTGGIGSGKSTVAKILSDLGVKVFSADEITHELMKPGRKMWEEIVNHFGEEILTSNNRINRKKLGEIIFNSPEAKAKLEEITHPFIIEELKERMQKADGELVAAEVPLLIEANMMDLFDEIWVVYVDREEQLKRIMERNDLTYSQAEARIDSQLPLKEKIEYADRVINNNGSREELVKKVKKSWKKAKKIKNGVNLTL